MRTDFLLMILIGILAAFFIAGILLLLNARKKNRYLYKALEDSKADAADAKKMLYTDALTGCKNARSYFLEKKTFFGDEQGFCVAFRSQGSQNSLKYVNDTFGYECGDQYILAFSQAIREAFSHEDGELFYLGASNFVLLGRGIHTKEQLFARFQTLKRIFHDTPYHVEGTDATMSNRLLQFAAVVCKGREDVSDVDDLIYKEVVEKSISANMSCAYYIAATDGKVLSNIPVDSQSGKS